jgi:hypothetical protein
MSANVDATTYAATTTDITAYTTTAMNVDVPRETPTPTSTPAAPLPEGLQRGAANPISAFDTTPRTSENNNDANPPAQGMGELPLTPEEGGYDGWQCLEKNWEIFEISDSESDAPPHDSWSREGACSPRAKSNLLVPDLAHRVRKDPYLWVGFKIEGKCQFCGRECLQATPLVHKGTAKLALFLKRCNYCGHEVEVDRWGQIPSKKDAICQVIPDTVDAVSEGRWECVEGRNTKEYHTPDLANNLCAAGHGYPIL